MIFKSNTMNLHFKDALAYLTFKELEKVDFVNHAFSTRLGGVSSGEFNSMNMSFNRGDADENVHENYRRLCAAIVVTYFADCTPVLLADTRNHAIGACHAGWRGTVGEIAEITVKKMGEEFGTDPADIKATIGPAISKCCYEVDEPVAKRFISLGLETEKIVFPKGGGKYMIDLLETNDNLAAAFLDASGLEPWQIQGYGLGVMNKRAEYHAAKLAASGITEAALYESEGRAFGPHGRDLVIANSIEHYDEGCSPILQSTRM